MTLLDLTGQESGIVVYEDKAVIVCNWGSSCPNGGLSRLAPWGHDLIAWPQEIEVAREYSVGDIRDALPGAVVETGTDEDGIVELELDGMELVADAFGDIPALWGWDIGLGAIVNKDDNGNLLPTAGKVYELDDAIIIAPEGWC